MNFNVTPHAIDNCSSHWPFKIRTTMVVGLFNSNKKLPSRKACFVK